MRAIGSYSTCTIAAYSAAGLLNVLSPAKIVTDLLCRPNLGSGEFAGRGGSARGDLAEGRKCEIRNKYINRLVLRG